MRRQVSDTLPRPGKVQSELMVSRALTPRWPSVGVRGVVPECSWPGPRKLNLNGWVLQQS